MSARPFLKRYRRTVMSVGYCSAALNILTFAGSAYMMMVYDLVLPSRSISSLAGLFLLLLLVHGLQTLFEGARQKAMLGLADSIRADLRGPVFRAVTQRSQQSADRQSDGLQPMRDLDQIHAFLCGPGPAALIDMPWVGLFLIVLFAMHWALGLTTLIGALILAALSLVTAQLTHRHSVLLSRASEGRGAAALNLLRLADLSSTMGMQSRLQASARNCDVEFADTQAALARITVRFGGLGRSFRILLQSVMLTVGAFLVLDGKLTGGIMLVSSLMTGRALAPVDQILANWRGLTGARFAWARLTRELAELPQQDVRGVSLPPPSASVAVRDLWVIPPGGDRFAVAGAGLLLRAGDAMAIIGPSAAGKTSLARALLGIWPAARGEVRFDGATLDQWDAGDLGRHLGYVPQIVELVEGTIGENIARLDAGATTQAILAASRAAGLHELILKLPHGYETSVRNGGGDLSAGQRQRIGLARALYGDPFLLVLDEANSNLDAAGDDAIAAAIARVRARGGIVIMVTHRPSSLNEISHVAVMREGRMTDFGPRDQVLERLNGPDPKRKLLNLEEEVA